MSEEAEHIPHKPVTPDQWQLRNFAQLIAAVEDGQLHSDITHELLDICLLLNEANQNDRRAKAQLTVTLSFKADRGVVEIDGDYKVKLPRPVRKRSLMHATGAYFSTRDPRQADLPLRGLPNETASFRSV